MKNPNTWPTLPIEITRPHVTLYYNGFRVDKEAKEIIKEYVDSLGKDISVIGYAYGNNGQNEGIAVQLPHGKIPYYGAKVQHITISMAIGAKAVDTANLIYSRHNFTNFIINGKVGFYMEDGEIIYSIEDAFGHGNVVYVGIFFDKEVLHNMSPEKILDYSLEQAMRLEFED